MDSLQRKPETVTISAAAETAKKQTTVDCTELVYDLDEDFTSLVNCITQLKQIKQCHKL